MPAGDSCKVVDDKKIKIQLPFKLLCCVVCLFVFNSYKWKTPSPLLKTLLSF